MTHRCVESSGGRGQALQRRRSSLLEPPDLWMRPRMPSKHREHCVRWARDGVDVWSVRGRSSRNLQGGPRPPASRRTSGTWARSTTTKCAERTGPKARSEALDAGRGSSGPSLSLTAAALSLDVGTVEAEDEALDGPARAGRTRLHARRVVCLRSAILVPTAFANCGIADWLAAEIRSCATAALAR